MAGLTESRALPKDLTHVLDILNCKNLDPTAVVLEPLPPFANGDVEVGVMKKMKTTENGEREIVLGRNIHSSCLDITEPEDNDELTGDKEAYMASVLARYRQSLLERTKYHLGNDLLTFML